MANAIAAITAAPFNRILDSLFADETTRNKYFRGIVSVMGVDIPWELAATPRPTVDFAPVPPDVIETAQTLGFTPDTGRNDYFLLSIPNLLLMNSPLPAKLLCCVLINDNRLQIRIDAIIPDVIDENTKVLMKTCGKIITDKINSSLPQTDLPTFDCVLEPPFGVTVTEGCLCLSSGGNDSEMNMPVNNEITLIFSQNSICRLIDKYIGYVLPHTFQGGGGGDPASYNYSAVCEYRGCGFANGRPVINVALSASASAGIDTHIFGVIGVNYSGNINPPVVPVSIDLFTQGVGLGASVSDVGGFGIVLTPEGGIWEKLFSSLVWSIAEMLTNSLAGVLQSYMRGMKFQLADLLCTIDILDVNYSFALSNAEVSCPGAYVMLSSALTVMPTSEIIENIEQIPKNADNLITEVSK
jgi:hypothetical protein